ncbi:MAG: glycine betaine ABC transporter substrate-binding protein, partial [Steroidobacteraceae bacterium]
MARFFKALCIAATIALIASAPARAGAPVVVSSKLSSESAMIGEMIRLVLSAAGITTVDRLKLGATPVVRRALLDGEVDLYVEYTGNGGIFFNM